MEVKFLGKLTLLLLLLCLLWPIAGVQQKPEIIKIECGTDLNNWESKIKENLQRANLPELTTVDRGQERKVNRQGDYQFQWIYNSRKLEVPLFGSQGQLLSAHHQQITAAFKDDFPVVRTEWTADENQQLLTVKLGTEAQSGFDLIRYQLQFQQPQPEAKLAVVIDDFGFNRPGTEAMLAIDRPLTLAVLPFRPQTDRDAKLARQSGQEIILHQPLEPVNSRANPGEGAITTEMSSTEIKEVLHRNLADLPPVEGMNNHMGSRATASSRVMETVMEVLKERELFYVDSSTTPNSIGLETAQVNQVPTTVNHLFIDNVDNKEAIKQMILRLGKVAVEQGELTIVGHVKENTAQALQETIPQLEKMGIKLVYVSQLVD